MTIIEVILVASSVINVTLLLLLFITFVNVQTVKIHIGQMHTALGTVLSRMLAMEQVMGKMATGFTEFINVTGNIVDKMNSMDNVKFGQVFKTHDGKYTATSIEDLISKIKEDGTEEDYFSDDDISKLKDMFGEDDDTFDED